MIHYNIKKCLYTFYNLIYTVNIFHGRKKLMKHYSQMCGWSM